MNDDLISRSALLEAMPKNDEIFSFDVRRVICNAPAVDAEPVRHGRWEYVSETNYHNWGTVIKEMCSVCGRYTNRYDTVTPDNYCPNCGAKMDGDVYAAD